MKKITIQLALIILSANLFSQGWIGNSTNNSIYPVNSSLRTSPVSIGIGTNSPSEQLHTTGGVRFTGLTRLDTLSQILVQDNTGKVFWRNASTLGGNAWDLLGNSNTNPSIHFLGTKDSQRLVFRTNNTEKMTILTNGNVGIGTNNPNVRLHATTGAGLMSFPYETGVFENTGDTKLGVYCSNANRNGGSSIAFGYTNFANFPGYEIQHGFRGGNDSFYFLRFNSLRRNAAGQVVGGAGQEENQMVLTDGNLVGINLGPNNGTPNRPTANFHTNGTIRHEGLPATTSLTNIVVADNNGNLSLFGQGANNTFLRGDGTWAVIPTTASSTTNNCGTLNMVPRLTGANTYGCGQIFDNGTNIGIGFNTGFTYTTSVWRSTGVAATGTLRMRVNGNVAATGFIATSDKTLKEDIQSIDNASKLISNIEGKTYFWKKDYIAESGADNGRKYGFLAQDLEKIIPEAVVKNENGRYGVDYNAIIPILVESQKEIIKENEELKAKLAIYDEKFALLEKTITQICENGCAGLEKKSDVDVLYQSIPNPTDNEALINYYLSKEYRNASISIATTSGKVLQTIKLETKQGKGSIKLELGQLINGIYLYTLTEGERVIDTKKLQILK